MARKSIERVGDKLQELIQIIKEEAFSEKQEVQTELLASLKEITVNVEGISKKVGEQAKETLQSAKKDLSEHINKMQEKVEETSIGVQKMLEEVEEKAVKTQKLIAEKYQEGLEKKNSLVIKTADNLIEAINNAKSSLTKKD